ncbi:MAG: (Fe-S)-binding protein [Candidatus Zipacnadales bacterium]
MLVKSYDLHLQMPKCNPYASHCVAKATLEVDVTAVFPYLNAELQLARYMPNAPAIVVERDGYHISIWPREILVTGCTNESEARVLLNELCSLINDIWDRRESIEPDHRGYEELTALEALKLLPGINCRECGEVACLVFAMKLVKREVDLANCPLILTDIYAHKCRALLSELLKRGYQVSIDAH